MQIVIAMYYSHRLDKGNLQPPYKHTYFDCYNQKIIMGLPRFIDLLLLVLITKIVIQTQDKSSSKVSFA